MKQAVLITAYKDFDQLVELVNLFDEDFNFYIHIDKKASLPAEFKFELLALENVKYLGQDYVVNWGGLNHLLAYLHLTELALKDEQNHFFHLITGQDYPIKSLERIKAHAAAAISNNHNYLTYFDLPTTNWKDGGMDRLNIYNFYDLLNAKKHLIWINRLRKFQQQLGIKRSLGLLPEKLFGGSTYWSLNRTCINYVSAYTKRNPGFLNRFRYTFCAEEIYFQTLIMNSDFASTVINDNMRFIDWESGKKGFPAFMDEHDFPAIMASNALFVRKIEKKELGLRAMLRNVNRKGITYGKQN
jgi:hypothetical protein